MKTKKKTEQGFALMDPARHREIAVMGGRSVPGQKRAFSTNRKLAVEAGRKGGMSVAAHKRSFSTNRQLASEAGKKGSLVAHGGTVSEEGKAVENAKPQS